MSPDPNVKQKKALDDLDFRVTLASLTRFAHKRSVSGQGVGRSAEN